MGFFSWKTSDTKETIWNRYTAFCRPVYLLMPDGNHVFEPAYDGYGCFGPHDAHVLLAKMNKIEEENPEELRQRGIDLLFSEDYQKLSFQLKFSFDKNADYHKLPAAENSDNQGYFDWGSP